MIKGKSVGAGKYELIDILAVKSDTEIKDKDNIRVKRLGQPEKCNRREKFIGTVVENG